MCFGLCVSSAVGFLCEGDALLANGARMVIQPLSADHACKEVATRDEHAVDGARKADLAHVLAARV